MAVGRYNLNYTPPYARGSGTNFDLEMLIQEWRKKMKEAKTANETRYEDILAGYRQRRTEAEKDIGMLGQTEERAISRRFKEMAAKQTQDLASRGLLNTTAAAGLAAGRTREENEALGGLKERLARLRLGILSGLEGDTLGFMERRNDQYPDLGQLQQLATGLGEAGPQAQSGNWLENLRRKKYQQLMLSNPSAGKMYGRKYGYSYGG